MFYRISYQPWGGADFRMLTAINIAQWDILGKASGLPVYKLLGGKAQEKLMVYNTMNGWPINGMREHTDPEKLTEFLLKRGIRGIKIYPYDRGPVNALAQHGGTFITQSELKKSLEPIQRMRKAAGDEIEIALDLSSRWNLPCSMQIAHSLEPYGIMWLEDPMLADNLAAYASLARETSIPICISERLATRYRFREMFEQHAVDVVMYDVTWCGGISEAKQNFRYGGHLQNPYRAAHRRRSHPLVFLDSHRHVADQLLHYGERVSPYNDVYPHFLKNVPAPVNGYVTAPETPGLGIEIREEAFPQWRRRDRDDRRIVSDSVEVIP